MAKKKPNATDDKPDTGNGEGTEQTEKKRNRSEFLLLRREGEDREWSELGILTSQQDCKVVANILREFAKAHDIESDDWQFTLRVVKTKQEVF